MTVNNIDKTHDPLLRSWVDSANKPGHDFPIQNLPIGMFAREGASSRPGFAIGDEILDLQACVQQELFDGLALEAARAACEPTLNALMSAGKPYSTALRQAVSDILRADSRVVPRLGALKNQILVPAHEVQHLAPCKINDYTDFLTSVHHTERLGRLKGLADPVPAAFKHLPVAYHGRASSLCVSGHNVRRPNGQWRDKDGAVRFGAVRELDFELEFGAFVGSGNALGQPVRLEDARKHIFGYCLLNDWSAKSVQWWEQILGPFLGKSFCTMISPWIVMEEALAPFRVEAPTRTVDDPKPLPYLSCAENDRTGGLNIGLQAYLSTGSMRARGDAPEQIVNTHLNNLYWTFPQMLTHHASNGCNLRAGDLMGSGTISGLADESMACLTEKTSAGLHAIALANGEQREWLQDGDEVIFAAKAEREGYVPIGFGECRGRVEAAIDWPTSEQT